MREFIVVVWPVILVSSVVLSVLSYFGLKELTLVMLAMVLGISNIGEVLSHAQILVLVIFTMLDIPCIATIVE